MRGKIKFPAFGGLRTHAHACHHALDDARCVSHNESRVTVIEYTSSTDGYKWI